MKSQFISFRGQTQIDLAGVARLSGDLQRAELELKRAELESNALEASGDSLGRATS